MQRRLVIAGLAASLAAPAFLIQPATAAIAFTCDSVTGSAVFSPGVVHDKRPQSLSVGPTALAGPADVALASTSDAGLKGNGHSGYGSLSADGTKVAFVSEATNLDPADTDATSDVYVKNLVNGDITLASTSDAGIKGNDGSYGAPSLSHDGTRVAFWSWATNLDPGDTDSEADAYVKDLATGDITLASVTQGGIKGNDASLVPMISGDGTKVAFYSWATNLDPADTEPLDDVYVKDLTTGDLTLASTSDTGVKGNERSLEPVLSVDGQKVAFESHATNFDPADPDAYVDIYVKNLNTGNITLASSTEAGVSGDGESSSPSLSADGSRVAFNSSSHNLDPPDSNNPANGDVYVKELASGDITRANTTDTGVQSNRFGIVPSLSADGTRVAFWSGATNLDPADLDRDILDSYVKNLETGDITLASTSGNGVKGNSGTQTFSLSADGTRVAFSSVATNLHPGDTDSLGDVYVKQMPSVPTSIAISGCSNGNSGTASVVDIRSYGPRPLGCPTGLGGAAGNDYADTTPILVGANLGMTIDWATGPNSYGVAAAKAGPTGTQWRFRLAITASPGHDTPATNQYLPASGSGFTKTRLQGKFDVSALDSFNCASGTADPLSWLSLANNGIWVAKTS